jgi:hypothetical protein
MRKLSPSEQSKLKVLRAERDLITLQIMTMRAAADRLEQRGHRLALEIADLTGPLKTRRGLPTGKNANLHVAWETFKVMTWSGRPLLAKDFHARLRQEISDLKPVTCRSYLHRLKKLTLIEKRGCHWHRVDATENQKTGCLKQPVSGGRGPASRASNHEPSEPLPYVNGLKLRRAVTDPEEGQKRCLKFLTASVAATTGT